MSRRRSPPRPSDEELNEIASLVHEALNQIAHTVEDAGSTDPPKKLYEKEDYHLEGSDFRFIETWIPHHEINLEPGEPYHVYQIPAMREYDCRKTTLNGGKWVAWDERVMDADDLRSSHWDVEFGPGPGFREVLEDPGASSAVVTVGMETFKRAGYTTVARGAVRRQAGSQSSEFLAELHLTQRNPNNLTSHPWPPTPFDCVQYVGLYQVKTYSQTANALPIHKVRIVLTAILPGSSEHVPSTRRQRVPLPPLK